MLDFLGTLLYFYNISFDFVLFGACFHTYFGIYWSFYSLTANCPTNAYQNNPMSWTFSDILLKSPTLCFAICQKRQFRHSVCIIAWTFLRNPSKVQLLPSYASKDKSVHNEIKDFYAHMSLTHERRSARCFCRYSGNIGTIFPT